MKPLIVVMLLATSAHAQWRSAQDRLQGGTYLHYELTGLTAIDDDPARMRAPNAQELVLAGARLGGFLGTNASVNYHIALDLFAGSTLRAGGFAYDVVLYPAGAVLRFGTTSVFGVAGGVGASGAVGTVDDALLLPLQVMLEAGRAWRLLARARLGYVVGSDSRQSAAPSVPFADELDAMIGLRPGRHYDKHGFPTGNGYFLAVNYREQAGTRYVGATIGYSIDAALPRRFGARSRRRR
jgi:hypothetical protein